MNMLRLLMDRHDRLEGMLADLSQVNEQGEGAWLALRGNLLRELRRYFELEEREFYAVIAPRLVLVGVNQFLKEQERIRDLLVQLETAPMAAAMQQRLVEVLHDALVRYFSDQEIELFPEVKRRLGLDELEEIGRRFQQAMSENPEASASKGAPAG